MTGQPSYLWCCSFGLRQHLHSYVWAGTHPNQEICSFHSQLSHHHSSANVPLLLPLLIYLISSTLLLPRAQLETLKCSFSFQPLHIWPSKWPAVTPRPVQLHLEQQNPTASKPRSNLLQSKWCGLTLWFYWDQNRGPDRFRLFHVHKTHTVEHPPEDKAPVKGPPPGQKPLCSFLDFSSVNLALCSASTWIFCCNWGSLQVQTPPVKSLDCSVPAAGCISYWLQLCSVQNVWNVWYVWFFLTVNTRAAAGPGVSSSLMRGWGVGGQFLN